MQKKFIPKKTILRNFSQKMSFKRMLLMSLHELGVIDDLPKRILLSTKFWVASQKKKLENNFYILD